ncbi:MAG: zinc ribbon domain-containing protein [Chloroflexi bacterium]|nr:zinc ribbon domain-containing protein [Chloroflexota bacterium]
MWASKMPIYEYRCNACARRLQLFFRSFAAVERAVCPHCQSADLRRLPSRVSVVRSESSQMDLMSDPSNLENLDFEDPRAVAQWAKQMGEASGIDGGSEYDEMIERLEHGEGLDDEDAGDFSSTGLDDEL